MNRQSDSIFLINTTGAFFATVQKGYCPMKKEYNNKDIIPVHPLVETGVAKMIQVIRGKQVLLDRDLATLYEVETRIINQAVKRNPKKFPERFCFQLDRDELPNSLISQIVILNENGNKRGLHIKKNALRLYRTRSRNASISIA